MRHPELMDLAMTELQRIDQQLNELLYQWGRLPEVAATIDTCPSTRYAELLQVIVTHRSIITQLLNT